MAKTKVIILNGPPSSGKDSLAEVMRQKFGAKHRSFKTKLIELTLSLFGVSRDHWNEWYTTKGKEIPRTQLGGRSCREALIYVSEKVIKPFFGHDYFGKAVLSSMPNDGSVYVFSDGGFPEELIPFMDAGFDVRVVRLHREDHTFGNDSRDYLIGNQFPSRYPILFTDEHFTNYENPADYDAKLDQVAARLMELVK